MELRKTILAALAALVIAVPANAADVLVTADITTSTTWVAANRYLLRKVVYVKNAATLTIEPGTKIIGFSDTELGAADSAALVITRGSQIFADGTEANPIIFTADEDDFINYQDGLTKEWGNLTILGDAFIADGTNCIGVQNGTCFDNMEGLAVSLDSRYGGTNDDHSIGRLQYVSIRYNGDIASLAAELNGISIGGVGRESEIHHIDILNNVDDGAEIWGGTVGLRYISMWNVGDDSFDLDEGYRGKAQFLSIVQGYSDAVGTTGSGVGDNIFEMDGGENSTLMQPYADPQIYNVTAIGQNPVSATNGGNFGLAFRDNMRLQLGNSIFMDVGDDIINLAATNNAQMVAAFTTDEHDTFTGAGFTFPIAGPPGVTYDSTDDFYGGVGGASDSRSGKWSWVKNSIFKSYEEIGPQVGAIGLLAAANGNLDNPAGSPIVSITRDVAVGPQDMQLVTDLDPRAAGPAVHSGGGSAPADGFFAPVTYIGAFSPKVNWLCGWTSMAQYGLIDGCGGEPVDPTASIALATVASFDTEAGVWYTIEQSPNGVNGWYPIGSVLGNGHKMYVGDIEGFDPAQLFRVIAQ